nr:hypothetical protein [Tanacetum cinerariifolium]
MHHIIPIKELNGVSIAFVAGSGVISKSTNMIFVFYGELSELNALEPEEVVDVKKEVENGIDNEAIRSMKEEMMGEGITELVKMPRSQPIGYYLKHEINKELFEGLARNQWYNDSLLATRSDFVILDVKEDKKKPFISGTPFLTTTKARIRAARYKVSISSEIRAIRVDNSVRNILRSRNQGRMILKPGDTNREVPVNETFHVQTDDELIENKLKQIEADDQAIQAILLGLPEDIYAAKEVDELKVERLIKIQDPLALTANSKNPYAFPAPHQDQPSFNQNYMQQPMPNPEDITDPTSAMNITLALMAKAFQLNY